ncbi:hypothetical protein SM907_24965 (plasmid) [Klebsiella aerogenes]|uniref:hypothetical protein n=1 Tax=Klebsiella aerogenes TaxID=548 RepID=UPI002A7EBD55|nr:hypothetical protein [Klebsiella aerogenes]WPS10969.1 hypothetical protein SM907_24965 [Klebsiella aerogenes]
MKKMVLLFIVQAISCLIGRWDIPSTLFVTLTLAVWFLIFYYVFLKIGKGKSKSEANNSFYLYLVVVCVSAFASPVVCLLLSMMYPLFAMNKYCRFVSFHKKGVFKGIGYGMGTDRNNQVSPTPYSGCLEHKANLFESHETLDTSSLTSADVNVYKGFEASVDTSYSTFTDVNPASGLPMIGNIDVAGNPYGIDRHD